MSRASYTKRALAEQAKARAAAAAESAVNHPKHYNANPSGVECITIVEHMSFNVGNAMKYLWRADEKGAPVQDLQKARWYIDREIEKRQKAAAAPIESTAA